MGTAARSLPGLDLGKLSSWLSVAIPGAGAELSGTLLAGGKSNLTYVVSDGASNWIVRRPPLGHVLPTAHDMAREYRIMSALQGTDVPVPATFALCDDACVVGAPFYVMACVEGRPYRYAAELEPLGPARTRRISEGLVDTLAVLHAVDPLAIGLGNFGRPEGFLERQVRLWKEQMEASSTRDRPAANELHRLLCEDIPGESAGGIVHGDYRLDNILTDEQDRPAAVIDWEMATLGDPLTDLALLCIYGRLGEQMTGKGLLDSASAPGFLSEDEIIARYESSNERDLSGFGFYLGLASYKLTAILEGIHYRSLRGQTVGDGFAGIVDLIEPLLEAGLTTLKEHR